MSLTVYKLSYSPNFILYNIFEQSNGIQLSNFILSLDKLELDKYREKFVSNPINYFIVLNLSVKLISPIWLAIS